MILEVTLIRVFLVDKKTLDSDLDVSYGVGSSSALRLGVCGAFFALQKPDDFKNHAGLPREALTAAWQLQSEAQGQASGYDIVTQFVGGLVEFNFDYSGNRWSPHWFKHDLDGLNKMIHVFVGGRGAPTTSTIQTTGSWLDSAGRLDRLLDVSESLVDSFNACIHSPDKLSFQRLVSACAASRALFAGNPHFPAELAHALANLRGIDKNWTWKTTGAGGEDAVLVIAIENDLKAVADQLALAGWRSISARFTDHGAHILNTASEIKTSVHTSDLGTSAPSIMSTANSIQQLEAST
jgi:mevalonate kinase